MSGFDDSTSLGEEEVSVTFEDQLYAQRLLPPDLESNPDLRWRDICKTETFLPAKHVVSPAEDRTRGREGRTRGEVRFVAISDTHGLHDKPVSSVKASLLPEGDVLLHAGDFTNVGSAKDLANFAAFTRACEEHFSEVIVIAGNHDISLDPPFYKRNKDRFHHCKQQEQEQQQQQQQQQQRMVPPNPQPTSSTSKAPTVEPVAEVYVADPPEQPTSSKSTKKNASAKTKKKAKKKTKKQIEEEKREAEQAAAKADEETNDPLGLNSSRWGASNIGGHSMFGVTGTSTGFSQLGGVENSFMANLNPIVGGGDQRNGGSAVNPNDTSFKPEKSMFENMLENANRSASNSVRSEQGSSFSSPSKTKNKDQAAAALALAAAATGSPGVGAGLWDGFSNLGSDASNAGGIEFSKLEFSDATQQAFKQGGGSGATPKKRRAGSLNLSDEDVAASGLRSLSTPSPSSSKKKAKKGGEDSPGSKRKSLFSAVIGGSGEKKKRKSSSASL